jgi:hypothetical protein
MEAFKTVLIMFYRSIKNAKVRYVFVGVCTPAFYARGRHFHSNVHSTDMWESREFIAQFYMKEVPSTDIENQTISFK